MFFDTCRSKLYNWYGSFGMGIKLMDETSTARGFFNGIKAGTPIAIGYLPSALALGILARNAGLTAWESIFMSAVVFAGASQFVALNLYMLGASAAEIVTAVGVLNLRMAMMSSALSKRFAPGIGALKKSWLCFEITDESFSVAAMRQEKHLSFEFEAGLNLPGHFTWVFGTLLGYMGTAILPSTVQDSMGIAIYALFIGLLIPSVHNDGKALTVTAIAMAASAYIKWVPCFASMNRGIAIILSAGIAALFGAVVFRPVRGKKS